VILIPIVPIFQVILGLPTAASMAVDGSHYFNDRWSHAAAFVTSPPLRDDPTMPDVISAAVANDDYQVGMLKNFFLLQCCSYHRHP
jgi:hypothetical protein